MISAELQGRTGGIHKHQLLSESNFDTVLYVMICNVFPNIRHDKTNSTKETNHSHSVDQLALHAFLDTLSCLLLVTILFMHIEGHISNYYDSLLLEGIPSFFQNLL